MERTHTEELATTTRPTALEGGLSRLSWRSIFGGTFASLGVWLLLGAFGLGIGLTAVSPEEPNLRGVGIWLAVWFLIVPILAMFVGTLVSTRAAGATTKGTGVLYGVVVWGITSFIAAVFTISLVSSVVGRTVGAATQLVSSVGGAAVGLAQGDGGQAGQAAKGLASFLGIDRSDLMASVNRRLEAQGKPPIEAASLQAAIRDVANTAVRTGNLSEDMIVSALARNTALSQQDARELAAQIQQQWNETMGNVSAQLSQAAGTAADVGLRTLDGIGKVMWVVFGSLLLGLMAAIGAGIIATTGRLRHRPEAATAGVPLREAHVPT